MHLPCQVTSSWWVCSWKGGPTPWSGPCVETASHPHRWGTWTPSAWQQHMATGITHIRAHAHMHKVSVSQRYIHYHSIDRFTRSASTHLPLTKPCGAWQADIWAVTTARRGCLLQSVRAALMASRPCSWVRKSPLTFSKASLSRSEVADRRHNAAVRDQLQCDAAASKGISIGCKDAAKSNICRWKHPKTTWTSSLFQFFINLL